MIETDTVPRAKEPRISKKRRDRPAAVRSYLHPDFLQLCHGLPNALKAHLQLSCPCLSCIVTDQLDNVVSLLLDEFPRRDPFRQPLTPRLHSYGTDVFSPSITSTDVQGQKCQSPEIR